MHTQEMDRTIKRACRNTIGDAIRRSTGRNSEKDALIFGEQRWSYAGLDAGQTGSRTSCWRGDSKALFYDPQFQANVEEVRDEAGATIYGILRDRDDFDVVSVARSGDDPSESEADLDEEDVAQMLYTSGTTSAPKIPTGENRPSEETGPLTPFPS